MKEVYKHKATDVSDGLSMKDGYRLVVDLLNHLDHFQLRESPSCWNRIKIFMRRVQKQLDTLHDTSAVYPQD